MARMTKAQSAAAKAWNNEVDAMDRYEAGIFVEPAGLEKYRAKVAELHAECVRLGVFEEAKEMIVAQGEISRRLVSRMSNLNESVAQAMDAVLGNGAYAYVAGSLYDDLRARQQVG